MPVFAGPYEEDIFRKQSDNFRQALHVIARLADTGSREHIAEFGGDARPTGWMIANAMRDIAISNIGNDPVDDEKVINPRWLDAQSWLRKGDDMDHFKTYSAFDGVINRRFEIFWHAKLDHVAEWSTLYIGSSVSQSNPTIAQVTAFKKAFELLS